MLLVPLHLKHARMESAKFFVVLLMPIFIQDHCCEHKQQQIITTAVNNTSEILFSVTNL